MILTPKELSEAIKLLQDMPCYNPIPEILVSHDMAIDGGDPELEGTTFQEAQCCGKCEACVLQQIILPILQSLQNGELVEKESSELEAARDGNSFQKKRYYALKKLYEKISVKFV